MNPTTNHNHDVTSSTGNHPEPVATRVLVWRDPETGERLSVELLGSDLYFQRLVAAGFAPLTRAGMAGGTGGKPETKRNSARSAEAPAAVPVTLAGEDLTGEAAA